MIADPSDPGGAVTTLEGLGHRQRAELAIEEALRLCSDGRERRRPQLGAVPTEPVRELPAGIDL
ncbi:MAG: hypothetical protein WAV54_00265 [Acidimicrobiales bacterium]